MTEPFLNQALEILGSAGDDELVSFLVTILDQKPAATQAIVDWAVPERAFVRTLVFSKNRFSGTVKSFNAKNGFGFIQCDAAHQQHGCDVFLHGDQMGKDFAEVGTAVSFAILLNKEGKPQAFDVKRDGGGAAPAAPAGWGARDSHSIVPAAFRANKDWSSGGAAWSAAPGNGKFGSGKGMPAMQQKGKQAASWSSGLEWTGGWDQSEQNSGHGKGAAHPKGPFLPDAPPTSTEMPGVTDKRWEGTVKMFKESQGFGFIECHELHGMFAADVFAHQKQIGQLPVGSEVSFAVFLNKDMKPQAKDVRPLHQMPRQGKGDWQPDAPPSALDVPGITDQRFEGTIKSIFEHKGFGFIDCEALRPTFGVDVFVHHKQLQLLEGYGIGQPVSFEVFMNKDGKPQAKSLMHADSGDLGSFLLGDLGGGEEGGASKRARFA